MAPEGWTLRPLQSLLLDDAPGFWGEAPNGADDIAVLRSTNLRNDGRLDYSDIARRAFPEKKRVQKRLEVGDVLLERSGGGPQQPVGRVALFEAAGNFAYSNFLQRLRPDPAQVLPRFLFYALWDLHARGATSRLQQATTGIRNLQYDDYLARQQLVPPLAEQRKIAAILSSVDETIEKTEAAIAQLEVVKKAMLEELLTRGIPGRHARFKQTEVGEVPEEWTLVPLGDAGRWLSGGTPSKARPEFWRGEIPWVSPKDMKVSRIGDAIDHVNAAAIGSGTILAPARSILIVIRGMILAHSVPVALTTRPVAFNQDMKAIVASKAFVPEFLLYWLQSKAPAILHLVDVANHGTKRLPSELLFALPLAQPSRKEQEEVCEFLESVDRRIEAETKVLRLLVSAKENLSTSLLTGDVRVVGAPAEGR